MNKKTNQNDRSVGKYGETYQIDNLKGIPIPQHLYRFKFILLGDIAVGKTSILNRFIKNDFQQSYQCTINTEYKMKRFPINSTTMIELQIWDTCGEEKYHAITRQYYRNVDGVILVFDLNSFSSLEKVSEWLKDVKEYIKRSTIITLVGNKEDIENRPIHVSQTAKDFAKKNRIEYVEVSALTGKGVISLFEHMSKHLIRQNNLTQKDFDKSDDSEIDHQHEYHSKTLSIDKSHHSKISNESKESCC